MMEFGQLVYHRCNGNARNVMQSMGNRLQYRCSCGSWEYAFMTLGDKVTMTCECGKEWEWDYGKPA
jgi:hypothetical protein